ncbi:hypothetical protein HK103_004879 [Boothiomyces macroporosus]|uniref:Uncharacterized protein n=1 Tax=Boothiomyces macroporosus TaxID=261099 RepID=A0AAD5Y871_9FUNG|nr:hypothetical protein HK103_004879 [Boothiomyces macroporosus]
MYKEKRVLVASLFLPITTTNTLRKKQSFRKQIPISPVSFEKTNNGNPGLYNAVCSLDLDCIWIGTIVGLNKDQETESKLNRYNAKPVILTDQEHDGHYNQFCKQVLWKPFHYQFSDDLTITRIQKSWNYYKIVNQKFADVIIANYREGDLIWINDYHLMLVPEMVRKVLPKATIGFFLHIPFPSSEIFRCLSMRKELLRGLLGADLIGFQIYSFMRHFLMTCSRLLGLDSNPKAILMDDSRVAVGSFPIGIDLKSLKEKRAHPEVAKLVASLLEKYKGQYVLIGRDKNDQVKGVDHKLLAFERFLEDHPEFHGKVVLIQVSLSTATENEEQSNVDHLVSRINSRFGSIGYIPVVYLHQDISFHHYLALLTMADACLITSLRDGMNLTSHEYVICQEEKKSPLIISEFAGTYGNFGAALRVNPWNHKEVSEAIYEALTMNEEDKAYRWKMLNSYIATNTAQQYVDSFLGDLITAHEENIQAASTSIPFLPFEWARREYYKSNKRILFMDDEGTLTTPQVTNHFNDFQKDKKQMFQLLTQLCKDEKNHVYLMSSRTRADLEEYLAIPRLGISAESGCFVRFPDRTHWETLHKEVDMTWRKKVMEVRTPGSFIEEKEIGIAWHYGFADQKYGEWQAQECQNHISNTLQTFPIHILSRKHCIEVYLRNVSKATAVRRILQHHQGKNRRHSFQAELQSPTIDISQYSVTSFASSTASFDFSNTQICDFILAIGNDRTDEYMFEYLNKLITKRLESQKSQYFDDEKDNCSITSYAESNKSEYTVSNALLQQICCITCTVGCKSSNAKWHVSNISEMIQGVETLLKI